jgi:hypothetical protein
MSKNLLLPAMLLIPWLATTPLEVRANDDAAAKPTALSDEVSTFLKAYCLRCHQGESPKGKLDLTQFQTRESMTDEPQRWAKIAARVQAGEMPPKGSKRPPREELDQFAADVNKTLLACLCESGPKPGPAPLRRLNRTQYGATLRDLLGVQASLGQLLPEDGAGGEGFDNAAETLLISPLHAEKYLEAARAALEYGVKDPRSRRAFFTSKPVAVSERRRGRREETPAVPDDPQTVFSKSSCRGHFAGRRARVKSRNIWRCLRSLKSAASRSSRR